MIGKLLGTRKAIRERLDDVNLYNISDEDKEQMRLDIFNDYTIFKIIQRSIGIIIILTYVLAIIMSLIYQFKSMDYKSIIEIIQAFELGLVALTIFGFYYSGGALASFKDKSMTTRKR